MTVAALPATVSYAEDGVATAFPVPFRFRAEEDLVVERLGPGSAATLTLGIDYRVLGGETDAGGVVRLKAAARGTRLRVTRRTPRAQPMVYDVGDRFPAKSHEEAIDRATLILQEQDAGVDDLNARALLLPPGESSADLPAAGVRAGGVLLFDPVTGAPTIKPEALLAPGAPGPAGATFLTLAAFKAAPISNHKQALAAPGIPPGEFFFRLGDFTGRADDLSVIQADGVPLGAGAWVRSAPFTDTEAGALASGGALDLLAPQTQQGQPLAPSRGNVHAWDTAVIGDDELVPNGALLGYPPAYWTLAGLTPASPRRRARRASPASPSRSRATRSTS